MEQTAPLHIGILDLADRIAREQTMRLIERDHKREQKARQAPTAPPSQEIRPVSTEERSRNPLRPTRFADMVGQDQAKAMMQRVVATSRQRVTPLDHVLLVGPSGVGKSTFSHVIGAELGVDVYEVEAPVSHDTLLELREVMRDRDILRIEEIHQQAIMERRGRSSATQPEVLYSIMEDRTMTSGTGVLPYPAITVVGTTTDEGMLPDPFLNRFPLRPRLQRYSVEDLSVIAIWNGNQLGIDVSVEAAMMFAEASRGVPRQVNNYLLNALSISDAVSEDTAYEVLLTLNGTTLDGLTPDMQDMLMFLYEKGRQERADGEVVYQASANTVATGIGKSRDSKAIGLRVEPYLIRCGYVSVGHGGRRLTDAGIQRAQELLGESE